MGIPKRLFWVDVALDYYKDQAWIMRQSSDCLKVDLIDGSEAFDAGIQNNWIKDAVPGFYRLTLRPWSFPDHDGDYDTGIDVIEAKCLVPFPE